MKRKFYPLVCLCLFTLLSHVDAQEPSPFLTTTPSAVQSPKKDKKLPASASDDWYGHAVTHLENSSIAFASPASGTYAAVNLNNQLAFRIDEKGYAVKQMTAGKAAYWQVGFRVLNTGSLLKEPALTGENKVTYTYTNMMVEYVHEKKGLRQNFIIPSRLSSATSGLEVQMEVESSLGVRTAGDGRIFFHSPANTDDIKMAYDDLVVWDANHKKLKAKMYYDDRSNKLTLWVDDRDATYPVTIDPLNHSSEWATSADGVLPGLLNGLALQVQALYGFTVAGVGDVNGDGFDDVAISAPAMADVISGSGSLVSVGAVFLYFGSATGLPTAPSKTLQPNTVISGGLFGFSITAGDVTGDGINDLLISAPLDQASVNVGGSTVVNATVGKIYIYQGGPLTGTNPSPLVSINLTGGSLFNSTTVTINPLFGFSMAVAEDMNGDGKGEIVVGAPTYARISGAASIKTGGAFVFLSNASNTFTTIRSLEPPTGSLLGLYGAVGSLVQAVPIVGGTLWVVAGPLLSGVLNGQIDGLLFGFSVDAAGDFDNNGHKDVVVGAPAGVNLGALTAGVGGLVQTVLDILSGQVLAGTAYVYSGTGADVNTTSVARLQANTSGLLSNAANLFGYQVKGAKYKSGSRTGNILVGAPTGNVLPQVLNLQVKAGELHVFARRTGAFTNPVASSQVLSSPRSTSILSILGGQNLNLSLLYASSFDNMRDANCDGFADLVVGEPLSTAVGLVNTDVVGGSAYIYYGNASGTYSTTPAWSLFSETSPTLGVNATAMIGKSVSDAGFVMGPTKPSRALIGGSSNSLDFGSGLLNLGATLGTLTSFAADNNGLGKSYTFTATNCNITLPASLLEFEGAINGKIVNLNWTSTHEMNLNGYELERSINGVDFQSIAMVFARGEQRNEYLYPDKFPYMGVNYYRLKIKDNDARYTYSNIVMVRFNEKVPGDVLVSPNPLKAAPMRVKMTGLEQGSYTLKLHNSVGQELLTRQVNVTQHDQVETIPQAASLTPGIYWLNIYDKTQSRFKTVRVLIN